MMFTNVSRRRGFASVLAVALIALVAIALSALAAVMHIEVRQSIASNADVQIRQMLLAAEPFARASLGEAKTDEVVVPLPEALIQNGGGLSVTVESTGETSHVTISAAYGGFTRSQVLQFTKSGDHWNIKESTLLPLQRK